MSSNVADASFNQVDLLKDVSSPFVFLHAKRVFDIQADVLPRLNPANKSGNPAIFDCASETADQFVASSRRAFDESWCMTPPSERKEILLRAADLVRKSSDELGYLDSIEMGKPLSTAKEDVFVAAGFLQYYAEAIDKNYGRTAPGAKGYLETQRDEPHGVVVAITPWNFPVINAALKAAPALAAGNCVILKPSEHGSLSSLRFAEILTEAGLPPGVLNVATGGAAIAQSLIAHKDVDFVTFTGSTATGQAVMREAARDSLKPVMLECGGKNSQIVFADALDSEMAGAIAGFIAHTSMWNSGQVCVQRSRLLVEKPAYEPMMEMLQGICQSMSVGDPMSAETMLGPLAFEGQYNRVMAAIDEALENGAEPILDGRITTNNQGYFVGPTLLGNGAQVPNIWSAEIFGPVVTVDTFETPEQAVAMANDTPYGLAASLWTTNFPNAHGLSEKLRAGTVSVMARPAPPDGCWAAHSAEPSGQSGFGVEGGMQGLKTYSRTKATQFIY